MVLSFPWIPYSCKHSKTQPARYVVVWALNILRTPLLACTTYENCFTTDLMKSSIIDCMQPLTTQWTVAPMNKITWGDVQPSRHMCSFPGYAYLWKPLHNVNTRPHNPLTCRISMTLAQLIWKISFTSWDTIKWEGTSTLLFKSMKMSISSSSSTMENGPWWWATHNTIFIWNFGYEYIDPCTNAVMAEVPVVVSGAHFSAWQTRLLVLSSCHSDYTEAFLA